MLTFWPLCRRLLCHLDAVNWIPQWFRVSRVLGYLLPSGLTLYIYLSNTASGSKRVFWRSSQWRVALLWGYICSVHRLSNKPVCYTDVFKQETSAPWLRMDLPGWHVSSTKRESFHNTWVLIYTSLFHLEFPFLRRGASRRVYSFSSKISFTVSDCSSFQQEHAQRFYSVDCSSGVLPFIWGTWHIHYIFLNEWWFCHMCVVCRGRHIIQERKQCRGCVTLFIYILVRVELL